jgi:hypothetical protein
LEKTKPSSQRDVPGNAVTVIEFEKTKFVAVTTIPRSKDGVPEGSIDYAEVLRRGGHNREDEKECGDGDRIRENQIRRRPLCYRILSLSPLLSTRTLFAR